MRSGWVSIRNGRLRYINLEGSFWSSMAASELDTGAITSSAYYLYLSLNMPEVYPSRGPRNRFDGIPLHCLDHSASTIPSILRAQWVD